MKITCLSSDLPVGSRLLSGEAPVITFIISWTHWGVQKACPESGSEPTPRRKPRVAHASCCNAATWFSRLSHRSSGNKKKEIIKNNFYLHTIYYISDRASTLTNPAFLPPTLKSQTEPWITKLTFLLSALYNVVQ